MSDILNEFDAARARAATWEPAPVPDDWEPPMVVVEVVHSTPTPRRQPMFRKFLALFVILAFVTDSGAAAVTTAAALPPSHHVAVPNLSISQTLNRGDTGDAVRILQQVLVNAGWPTWVDGEFGPHTERTVTLYQKANGLLVDGIAGPQTLGHLGIWKSSTAPSAPTPAPPTAPSSTAVGPCSQWTGLAAEVGWPSDRLEWLSGIMWRESRCNPAAYNGKNRDRSYGLLQINTLGSLWGELQRRCGLTDQSQLHDARTNLACGYRLFQAYGTRPWRTS